MPDVPSSVVLTQDEVELIKRSLHCYSDMLRRIEESERVVSSELARANLLQNRLATAR
jgi:hypothetical protein